MNFEYTLHIQCPWRLVRQNRIVMGYLDLVDKVQPESPTVADKGTWTLLDTRRQELMQEDITRLRVESVRVTPFLDLHICFTEGYVLEAFPVDSSVDESHEYWRFFRTHDDASHVVAGPTGLAEK